MARKDGESVLRKVVTLSDVAALTVQSERSIQRLVKSGVIRLAKDRQRRQLKGRFVLGDCIPRICEHLRDQMTAADPNAAAYAEARARRMQCVAEVAELELKQKKRELHHARDVEFLYSAKCNCRHANETHLRAGKKRVAVEQRRLAERGKIVIVKINEMIFQALQVLSETKERRVVRVLWMKCDLGKDELNLAGAEHYFSSFEDLQIESLCVGF